MIDFANEFRGFLQVGTLREVFRRLGSASAELACCAAIDGMVIVCDGLRIERGVCHVGRLVAVVCGRPVVATNLKTKDVLPDDARRIFLHLVPQRIPLGENVGVLCTDPQPELNHELGGSGEPSLELARLLKGPKLDTSWWPQLAAVGGDNRSVDAATELSELLAPLPVGLAWRLSHPKNSTWGDVLPNALQLVARRFRHDSIWRNRLTEIAATADEAEAVALLLSKLRESEPRELPRVVTANKKRYVRRCVLVEKRSQSDYDSGVARHIATYTVSRAFRKRKVGLIVKLEAEMPTETIPVMVEAHDTTYRGALLPNVAQVCIGEFEPGGNQLTITVNGGKVKSAGLYFQQNV